MTIFRKIAVLAGLLPAFASPLAAAETDFQVPVIVDNAGKVLGPLIGETSAVLDVAPNQPFQVNLGSNGVFAYALGRYYPTIDCSGPDYIRMENIPPFASADPSDKNILIYANTTVSRQQVRSRNAFSLPQCRVLREVANPAVALAERTTLSALGFTPPFRFRFQALPPPASADVQPRPFAVDSTGKVVGAVFNSPIKTRTAQSFDFVFLRLKPANALVRIGVGRNGFESGLLSPLLFYLTKDCSGQAYFAPISGPFVRPTFIDDATGAILYPAGKYVEIEVQSVRSDAGAGSSCHAYSKPSSTLGERVLSTSAAEQGFTPPFGITLH